MKNPFWNREEKRLRALWRLILFVLMVGAGSALVSIFPFLLSGSIDLAPVSSLLGSTLSAITFVGVLWLAGRLLDRRRVAAYGFQFSRAWWIDFGFGLGPGAALMGLVFVLELGAGWVQIQAQPGLQGGDFWLGIFNAVILFIAVGIREEIFFRAYLLRNLAEGLNWGRIGPRAALIAAFMISSSIFGLAHLGNPNATWVSSFNIALAGFLLGMGLVVTGELAIPIGLHIGWNFFQGNVFGFPVSGTYAGATFITIRQGGPELLTGGTFGPEAGILGLFAMLLGCVLTLAWVRFRRGNAMLRTDLSVFNIIQKD